MSKATRTLLDAMALEIVVGDPISRWHPVAVLGRGIGWMVDRAPTERGPRQLVYGGLAVAASVGGVAGGATLALRGLDRASPGAALLAGAALLKASLSYRQLESEALRVAAQLDAGNLVGARAALRALVSRDTTELAEEQAASAAIESLAENLCDSFVAPLCFFLIGGVPGAMAYRAINTWDAMVGYHGRYEYLGRAAAKVDDAVNFVPARITAGLMLVAAARARADAQKMLVGALRDHRETESPNAGWPMAVMAHALGVRLEKRGHYCLGASNRGCSVDDVFRAARIARLTALGAAGLALLGTIIRGHTSRRADA
jgi:adenosylcobinamide-phosphate synthase